VTCFFHQETNTAQYVVADPSSRHCAIIDPVLDFDQAAGVVSTGAAQKIAKFIDEKGYFVSWILETHVHADHLSASRTLKRRFSAPIGIGSGITAVQEHFVPVFNDADRCKTDGSQFDHLFHDNEVVFVGTLPMRVLHTPGHTPACVTYAFAGSAPSIFVGDSVFLPDFGTARCDFPGGSAATLYRCVAVMFFS
jgi:glyoxylase-like metal-dependent hydrolase (beta-lactamase superfamily II)